MFPLWLIGIGSSAKNIAKKIPLKGWLILGGVVFYFGSLWYWGNHQAGKVQAEWDESVKRGNKVVKVLKEKQVQIVKVVEIKYKDKIKVIHEKGKTIIREIPKFIPADTCELPGGFRLLHDAAATGSEPDATGLPDAATVPVRTAAETISKNYETCHATAARLVSLQEFERLRHEAYLEACKSEGIDCN